MTVSEPQPFMGIATFGRQPHTREVSGADVAIVGVPFDSATSHRSGARFGPRKIRELSLLLWGYNQALAVAPFKTLSVVDYGDVDIVPVNIEDTYANIEREVGALLDRGLAVVALGGDHSITLALLRAHARRHGPLAVVHFDSHPDTWATEFGDRLYSHGTPFRRAIEEKLIDTSAYVQVGIRGPTSGESDWQDARDLGARVITMDEAVSIGIAAIVNEVHQRAAGKKVYVSFDIDAVDPAFAPGTGTPEVGGFTAFDALRLVRGLKGLDVVGFDLVEVLPACDHGDITAILAANLAFEFLSLLALGKKGYRGV
jgi:agmatinase/guanidinopropionase